MTRPFQPCFALLAGALALAAHGQQAPAPAADKGAAPKTIKIKARTNPGDLAYGWVFEDQKLLQRYLPAQDRMVDFSWRITFTELSLPEQDAFVPQGWAVALVGKGFEQDVPVARGGYFLLPALPLGRQSSTIMFKEQSMLGYIGAAWRVRVGADQRLPYAGFRQALDQVHAVQNAIPPGHTGLRLVRASQYDSLKACFLGAGGQVLIDGKPAADASFGHCALLKFDPARAAAGQAIEFKGALDVVTVVESADYLEIPARLAPEPADAQDVAADDDEDARAAHTNLSNLSYRWNFKRQLRLQGDPPGPAHLVDFVWRLRFEELSEAEQDAWAPQGWALGLVGKGFARAVPVARGGYFLLPALPIGRQASTLVFKEQDRRNLVEAAWVMRLRSGQRPYLHYGEFRDALKAVRKAQDEISDEHAELATLRAAHYDGLKACFVAAEGIVFVGDTPTAAASVGNCRVLKFDPGQDLNQTIEFVGPLDAVTVVDTARYLPPPR